MRKEQFVADYFLAASFRLTWLFNTAYIWVDATVQLHQVFQAMSLWAFLHLLFLGYRNLGRRGVHVTVQWLRKDEKCWAVALALFLPHFSHPWNRFDSIGVSGLLLCTPLLRLWPSEKCEGNEVKKFAAPRIAWERPVNKIIHDKINRQVLLPVLALCRCS